MTTRNLKAWSAFALSEAASLRRMVRSARIYGGALAIRDEADALERAVFWIRRAKEWRSEVAQLKRVA